MKVGFIDLGDMGSTIARNLIKAGREAWPPNRGRAQLRAELNLCLDHSRVLRSGTEMVNDMRKRQQFTTSRFDAMNPDEAKRLVRDGMVGMKIEERAEFIGSLAGELRRENITMSAYLIPLGIPGTSPGVLTPNEVGHLVRFLKFNVPRSIRAIERTLNRYTAFDEKLSVGCLAA